MAVNITQIAAATADPKTLSDALLARYLDEARSVLPYTSGYSDEEKAAASVVVQRLNAEFQRRVQKLAEDARKAAADATKGSSTSGGKKPAPKTPAQQEATQATQQAESTPAPDSGGGAGLGTFLLIGGGTAAAVVAGWFVYDQHQKGAFSR